MGGMSVLKREASEERSGLQISWCACGAVREEPCGIVWLVDVGLVLLMVFWIAVRRGSIR